LIAHNIWAQWNKPMALERFTNSRLYHALAVFMFFHLTCIGWVLFRVDGIHNAARMIFKMLTFNPLHLDRSLAVYFLIAVFLYGLHIVEHWGRQNYLRISELWQKWFPAPIRALVYVGLILFLIICSQTQQNNFIYFKF
jgi:alginate O-acetyltransferase complex protein AlgI